MLNVLRTIRLFALLAWTLVLPPFQLAALLLGLPAAKRIPVVFHRGVLRVLRIELDVRGSPAVDPPVLVVANHSSWLDIVVLSALLPVSFVSKAEIARWPGVSILARLQRSVFIERRRGQTREGLASLQRRLAAGDNLVLFAEGTSGDGNRIAPFKSAMFAAAEAGAGGMAPLVQPVSVAYTHLNGFPLGRRSRHRLTWYGRMPLGPHLWRMLGNGRVGVAVDFHAPVRITDFASRKELAAHCFRQITASHALALSGRPRPAADPLPAPAQP